MIFDYKGQEIFYRKYPSKGVSNGNVVFLHGWGCDGGIFERFARFLSEGCSQSGVTCDAQTGGACDAQSGVACDVLSGAGSYDVYSLDFPGFGQSAEPSEVWGVEDYTCMLEGFCKGLGIESPSLIGHSFGGRVAILFASRNVVSKMVLIDSAGVKPRRSLKYYIKVYSYKISRFILLHCGEAGRRAFERRRAQAGSSDYRNASDRMKAILSKVVNEDLCRYMPLIKAPTVLFWGVNDTATPFSDAQKMNSLIPDSGIVRVEGGTHFSFLEYPCLLEAVLRNFFFAK